jgi:3',5'-cyclic AMP phosphodiesterase CpdA
VRRRGRVTIFGLSTAVASGAFLAIGRLGLEQLELLERALTERAKHPSFKVVLLHHPPVKVPGDRMKRLVDAEGFRTVLARHQVDLVLHGHIHVGGAHWVPGAARAIPVLSVPSASATEHGEERAAYNLFRIEEAEEGWRCEQIVRGFSARRPGVAELARRILSPRLHEAA